MSKIFLWLSLIVITAATTFVTSSYSKKRDLAFDEVADIVSHLTLDGNPEALRACLERMILDDQAVFLDLELSGMARELNRRVVEIHRKRAREGKKRDSLRLIVSEGKTILPPVTEEAPKLAPSRMSRQFKFTLKSSPRSKEPAATAKTEPVSDPEMLDPVSRTLPRKTSPRIMSRLRSSNGSDSSSSTESLSRTSSFENSPRSKESSPRSKEPSPRSKEPSPRLKEPFPRSKEISPRSKDSLPKTCSTSSQSSPRTPESSEVESSSRSPSKLLSSSSSSVSLEDQVTRIGSEYLSRSHSPKRQSEDKQGGGRRKSHGDKNINKAVSSDRSVRKRSSSETLVERKGSMILRKSDDRGKTHFIDILPTSMRSPRKQTLSDEDEEDDDPKDSILLRALRDSTFEHVQILIKYGAKVHGNNLHKLCSAPEILQRVEKLMVLMNSDGVPFVNAQDANGSTALHLLLQRFIRDPAISMKMLKILVDNGANADIPDQYLRTPLYYFLEYVYFLTPRCNEILEQLLRCCDPFQIFGQGYEIIHLCYKDSDMQRSERYEKTRQLCKEAKEKYHPGGVWNPPFPRYDLGNRDKVASRDEQAIV